MSGAARTIAIRLSAENAETVRRSLEKLGADGKKALEQIDSASAKAQPAMRGLASASDAAVRSFGALGNSLGSAGSAFVSVAGRAGGAAAALAAVAVGAAAAGSAIARAGDQATESLARLQAATGSFGAAEKVYQNIYALSQQTGVAISESANAFARFAIAAREIGATNDQVLALVRTVQQAGIIAGASTAETSATVMQLGQALASGRLQGDELRSVLENMPTLAEALARELGASVGELRKTGEAGKLTADVVMPALIRAGQSLNAEFEKMPPTMGRAFSILGEAMSRFAGDLDRALGLSQGIARAAQAAAAAVNQGRVAVGLGTPMEQASAGYDRSRDRLAVLDQQIANAEAALAETAMPGGTRGIMRRNLENLRAEREAALRELQTFITRRSQLEREAQEAGEAETHTASQRAIIAGRRADQARLEELYKALDKERGIRAEHAERVQQIDALAARGAIEAEEATRLRTAADKDRDEALARLTERTETTRAATERLTEAERAHQRLVERGTSLVEGAATEQEKYAEQVKALDAALAAARITQEQYNRTLTQLDPAARAAREAAAKAEQEAARFAERSREALASIGETALDRIGNGLVNAFAAGKQAAIDFGSIARQVVASVVTDMAKLAIVNPLVNAVFGASRPSLMGAFGGAAPATPAASVSGAGGSAGMFSFAPLPFLNMGASNLFGGTGGLGEALGLTGAGGFLSTPIYTPTAFGATQSNFFAGTALPGEAGFFAGGGGAAAPVTLGNLLGAGAMGFGLGMAGGTISGSLRGTADPMPGTLIGTGLGMGLGFLVGGPLGMMIGGAIGGTAGGLFGPTKKGMAARSGGDVFLGVDDAGLLTITGARGKRWDQASAVAEVQQQLDAINRQISARNLSFAAPGQHAVGFGPASGSPRELSMTALVGQLRSDNANQMTAFGTLAGRGGDLEEALSAADFVTQVFEPLGRAVEKTSAFRSAMDALTKTYDEAITKARDLGLSEADLNTQRAERIAKLEADRARDLDIIDRSLGLRRLALNGDSRGVALGQFDLRAEAELRAFREQLFQLGLEETGEEYIRRVVALEQTIADERLAVIRQFDAQLQGISRGLLENLTMGDLGGLPLEARYGAALASLSAAQAPLLDGATPEELAEFSRVAQIALPIAKDFLGISTSFAELVADVARTLRTAAPGSDPANLGALLEAQVAGADRLELAVLSTGQTQTEVLRSLLSELRRLTAQNEAILARAST
ncbi:MAG: tape measure protein [Roseomonas sp.]|nr:tape measure protein [Roseomonas sp.]MCA3458834.1 tape measure protein [Rhodobacter sp.]MCA3586174.1 tape measure protein [Methylocystis sp.]MCA3328931.1 tape measure protein [Roseomonas sp.]MCA3332619.1 tape measure protein [Roseomonas sp.]